MDLTPKLEQSKKEEVKLDEGVMHTMYDLLESQNNGAHLFTDVERTKLEQLKKDNPEEYIHARNYVAYWDLTPEQREQVDKYMDQQHFKEFMKKKFGKDINFS